MREIKFRSWNSRAREMVTPAVWINDENLVCSQMASAPTHELMQFTGLKDLQGVDIYEGDIVTWGDIDGYIELSGTRHAVVDYSVPSDGLTFAAFKPSNHRFKIGNFMYARSTERCMTVIGNIHENPELLEGEE